MQINAKTLSDQLAHVHLLKGKAGVMNYRTYSDYVDDWIGYIELRHDDVDVRVEKKGKSPEEAFNAAYQAFRSTVTGGLPIAALLPPIEVEEKEEVF